MSRSRFLTRCIGALLGALLPFTAHAQQALLQGGTWTAGHGLMYGPLNGSQPVVLDSGSAPGGGTVNTGSAGQFAYYPSSTAAVSGSSVLSVSGSTVAASGPMTVGSTFSATGATSLASTLAVSGHVTFEGVTSTGATGAGALVFGTSPTLASPTISGTISGSNILPLAGLAQAATNTVLGNATSGTANITALAVPSCSSSASAITWTTNTGWGCNTLSSGFVTTFSAGTTGFTPNSATSGAVTLAGTLIPANGGTGFASYAVGDVLYADTTTSLAKLADIATGNVLLSGGVSTAPAWGKVGLTTAVTGTLPVGNGGTGAATFTANGVLYGNTTSAFGVTAAGTTGQYFKGVTSGAPAWSTLASDAVTALSFGTTGLTPSSGTQGSITVAGTLVAANGGTGQASYTTGDIPYASASTTISKLADVATGQALMSGGVGVAPAYTGSPSFSGSVTAATGLTVSAGGAAITGNSSISSGSFTASGGAFTASPASANVVMSPTGTGVVTINPATAGTVNNVVIGGSTPLAGTFTTLADSVGNVRSIIHSGSDKTTTYVLATTDNGQYVSLGASGAITVPNSTFADGNVVSVFNNTASGATITINATTCYIAGTNTNKGGGGTVTLATRGTVTILFTGTTSCVMNGNVS